MSLDLIRVPGRTLTVGEPFDDVRATWESYADLGLPWHYFAKQTGTLTVEVADLDVQRCPLTWAELADVAPELAARLAPPGIGGDHPVDGMTWEEASDVASRLADRHGLPLRLATEFEWENVARGGTGRLYPWGETFDSACANLAEAGVGGTEPVGSRPLGASEAGVLDLAGNVDEWTASIYAPYPGAHWTTPRTETWAVDPHVTRGGSFAHHRDLARARRRHAVYRPWDGAGMRVVADIR